MNHAPRARSFEDRIAEHEAAGRVVVRRGHGYAELSKPSGSESCVLVLATGAVLYRFKGEQESKHVGSGLACAFACIGVRA